MIFIATYSARLDKTGAVSINVKLGKPLKEMLGISQQKKLSVTVFS
jgi:hypothetical protein